jgi:Lar family restriction alleviation protein
MTVAKPHDLDELLPCPFCGSGDIGNGIVREHSLTSAAVHCKQCGGAVLTIGGSEEARRRWNTRASLARSLGGG